jgi:hypothetical protein
MCTQIHEFASYIVWHWLFQPCCQRLPCEATLFDVVQRDNCTTSEKSALLFSLEAGTRLEVFRAVALCIRQQNHVLAYHAGGFVIDTSATQKFTCADQQRPLNPMQYVKKLCHWRNTAATVRHVWRRGSSTSGWPISSGPSRWRWTPISTVLARWWRTTSSSHGASRSRPTIRPWCHSPTTTWRPSC